MTDQEILALPDAGQYRVEIWASSGPGTPCGWQPDSHTETLADALHLADCARRFGAWPMVRVIALPA